MIPGNSILTSPDSVKVWHGFRLATLPLDQFYSKLGTVFIPATVKLQIDAGLRSYTPSVPAGLEGKPDWVPDETAILFWKSPQTYWNGFTRLAVRTYTLTHGGVYNTTGTPPMSGADFPVFFTGVASLNFNTPVYLFNNDADWMNGSINHLVAERPRNMAPEDFKVAVAAVLTKIQALNPTLGGAIALIGNEYILYWELGAIVPDMNPVNVVSGIPLLTAILTGWSKVFKPAPTFLPIDLYDVWAGMDVAAGSSFNMQFQRNISF
jgi:hypothetical protein